MQLSLFQTENRAEWVSAVSFVSCQNHPYKTTRNDFIFFLTLCKVVRALFAYILLTEQFEVISLWRDTQPLLVQEIQLVDSVDVGSAPLHHLVGVHCQLLHPARDDVEHVRTNSLAELTRSEHGRCLVEVRMLTEGSKGAQDGGIGTAVTSDMGKHGCWLVL